MIRLLLLAIGFAILFLLQWLAPISLVTQTIWLLGGILVLGVPHGAADLLVANRNATEVKKTFQYGKFFINYLGRLVLFAVILYFLPLTGNFLFILFAAFHFGETDLSRFSTKSFTGKLFVVSYGLLVLGVILLHHFEEVKPLFQLFPSGVQYTSLLNELDKWRYTLLSFFGFFFFVSCFVFFRQNPNQRHNQGSFLVQLGIILFLLYQLPMLLGFTFYFILWHSVLSMENIIRFLRRDALVSYRQIFSQMVLYSVIAIAGILLFGITGFMYLNSDTLLIYVLMGLAVLTAPHMQIMHDMYHSLRQHAGNSLSNTTS